MKKSPIAIFELRIIYFRMFRVACLPSIPMASVIFSILSIIKSMFDLNVYPLLTTQVKNALSIIKSLFDLNLYPLIAI